MLIGTADNCDLLDMLSTIGNSYNTVNVLTAAQGSLLPGTLKGAMLLIIQHGNTLLKKQEYSLVTIFSYQSST